MTDTVVVEGQVRFRDGKKWKSRWVALRKPSPVADCLLLLAYKDKADKTRGHRERSCLTLEHICGLEPLLSFEGIPYTLAILCLSQPVLLGFESREALLAWDARIRYSLGEVHRFSVGVQPGTKLESGPATLHLCNNLLGIARDLPPIIVAQWKLSDLRRYGAVPNGFVFEGGTRCGYWAGVFFLSSSEGEQISFLVDCVVRGISPTRGPSGLRPPLPDPNVDPAHAEERLNQEAEELEKRLSMLSHCSRQSSSASTYSYGASVAGDDRSISSSSSSQSDTSIGSRLTIWAEPAINPAPSESLFPPVAKGAALHGEEKLYGAAVGGARAQAQPPRSRQLQEIGRQSSSDSGIATGSHSSYTGSFSSYAGSIDTAHGDEFGSLLSLPPSGHAPDQVPCSCPVPEGPGSEYQPPSALMHHYDTPRSLLLAPPVKDHASLQSGSEGTEGGASTDPIPKLATDPQSQAQAQDSPVSATAPSVDPCEICIPQPGISRSLFAACPICGGLKGPLAAQSGVPGAATIQGSMQDVPSGGSPSLGPKNERLSRGGGGSTPLKPEMVWPNSTNDKDHPCQEVCSRPATEDDQKPQRSEDGAAEGCGTDKSAEQTAERGRSLEMTDRRGQQKPLYESEDPKGSYEQMAASVEPPKRFEPCGGEYGGAFVFPPEASSAGGVPERVRGDGVTYVNIPVSPTSKKQLHYMELELQEPGSGVGGGGSTKYAQIDIAATETAHRVGSQHAQGREDRLQELEQKKKGAQP